LRKSSEKKLTERDASLVIMADKDLDMAPHVGEQPSSVVLCHQPQSKNAFPKITSATIYPEFLIQLTEKRLEEEDELAYTASMVEEDFPTT
jgi:hypothetical protein